MTWLLFALNRTLYYISRSMFVYIWWLSQFVKNFTGLIQEWILGSFAKNEHCKSVHRIRDNDVNGVTPFREYLLQPDPFFSCYLKLSDRVGSDIEMGKMWYDKGRKGVNR